MTKKKDPWEQITETLRTQLPPSEFDTWLSHTQLEKLEAGLAVIQVSNKFVAGWLRDGYLTQIREAFRTCLNVLPEIQFNYKTPDTQLPVQQKGNTANPPARSSHPLNSQWTFENFITGGCNRFASALALEVSRHPGVLYNPLYIFSKQSLGKTHLLNAVGNRILAEQGFNNILYITAEEFASDFLAATKTNKLIEFRQRLSDLDFLILDDVHRIGPNEKAQDELISLFNSLYESKKQIMAAGNAPPGKINGLIPNLTSRLEWGLLSEIHPPDQKTKIKIMKQTLDQKGLLLPKDVIFFLAGITDDLKKLVEYIFRLKTYTSTHKQEIGISTVKSLINKRPLPGLTVKDVQKTTARYFNISLTDLLSDKKTRQFSYPRQVAMHISRELTNLSLKEIGKAFGGKHHATVIYALKRIEEDKQRRSEVLTDIHKIEGSFI
jgi:chromosomal replication initiator protein